MSREIKFRFIVDGEVFSQEEIQKDPDLNLEFHSDGFKLFTFVDDGFCGRYDEIDILFEQFTGLTDSNWVDIYQGDIVSLNNLNQVESSNIYFEVKWCKDNHRWIIYYSDIEFYDLSDFDAWVIGNIHQK